MESVTAPVDPNPHDLGAPTRWDFETSRTHWGMVGAQLTGESMADAVAEAIRERLGRVRKERVGLAKRLMAIGEETAPYFTGTYKTIEHGDLLYDENGLPK